MPRDDRLPAALLGALVPAGLAFANGGYFPRDWGMAALLLLLVAATALLLRDRVAVDRLSLVPAAALALLGLWQLVTLAWSPGPTEPVLEAERTLVYLALSLAAPLVVSRASVQWLLGGVAAGVAIVCYWALATKLAPGRFEEFEPGRLAQPIGYSNATGMLAVVGLLVSAGFVAHGRVGVRCAAAATSPFLAATLALTFSRGPWIALVAGGVVLITLLPERTTRLILLLPSIVGTAGGALVILTNATLSRTEAAADAVRDEGPMLALLLVLVSGGSAGAAAVLARLEPRLMPSAAVVGRLRIALAATAAMAAAFILVLVGNPVSAASRAYDGFTAPPAASGEGESLGDRLASASGNGRSDFWSVALREAEANPLLGGGAGSYERWWFRLRPTPFAARDAHSLYLESLAELGPVGLVLVLSALSPPLIALVRERRRPAPLLAAAAGAYAAFLLHAGVDWDWEIPALTGTAITVGFAVVIGTGDPARPTVEIPRVLALTAVAPLVIAAGIAFFGNAATAESDKALDASDADAALAAADRAVRFAPWSTDAIRLRAEARTLAGDAAAGRRDLRAALARDEDNWRLWYALALATTGGERRRATERVLELNPRVQDLAPITQ